VGGSGSGVLVFVVVVVVGCFEVVVVEMGGGVI